jgi:hypothetical protein
MQVIWLNMVHYGYLIWFMKLCYALILKFLYVINIMYSIDMYYDEVSLMCRNMI